LYRERAAYWGFDAVTYHRATTSTTGGAGRVSIASVVRVVGVVEDRPRLVDVTTDITNITSGVYSYETRIRPESAHP